MSWLITLMLAVPGLLVAAFTLYQTFFLILGLLLLSRRSSGAADGPPSTRFVILTPAHNEAGLIGSVVASLLAAQYPKHLREIVVIADNCTDETAQMARNAGALCHERHDLVLRGKPYALDWMISRLDLARHDAVIIVDADTVVDPGFLAAMDNRIRAGEQSIQGYFGVMNPDENWLTRLGVLPAVIKFRLHFPAKRFLGLSCPLAGNGMCFSANLMRTFGWKAFSITENWEYYVMLALRGVVTTAAPEAVIYSQVAKSLKLGETQRMRWMRGRLDTLQRYWKPLLRARPLCLDVLIELARPSHANLLLCTMLYMILTGGFLVAGFSSAAPWLTLAMVALGLQAGYFFVGLAIERPPLKTWLALLMVPWYLIWKGGISLRGLLHSSHGTWVKTTRN